MIKNDDVIVEFETSSRSMNPGSLDDHLQLTDYSYAYRVLFGKDPRKLKVVNFVKTMAPKMITLDTSRKRKDYEILFYIAREVLKGISDGVFFPKPSFMCKDREYRDLCKAWKGNGKL